MLEKPTQLFYVLIWKFKRYIYCQAEGLFQINCGWQKCQGCKVSEPKWLSKQTFLWYGLYKPRADICLPENSMTATKSVTCLIYLYIFRSHDNPLQEMIFTVKLCALISGASSYYNISQQSSYSTRPLKTRFLLLCIVSVCVCFICKSKFTNQYLPSILQMV